MKGLLQLQTIIYVIFAVILVLVGTFSVQAYLSNVEVDATYELSNMDFAILGKRIVGSTDCFSAAREIKFPAKDGNPTYSVFHVDEGLLETSKISDNARLDNCFVGFDPNTAKVSFFRLSGEKRTEISSWGSAECIPAFNYRKAELIVRLTDGISTVPGVVELCIEK